MLLGEVVLDQREELLDVAAVPREQVTVPVTEERQTLILEEGAEAVLDFNQFLLEASTSLMPADNLTVTLTRQLLDESGRIVPNTTEELSPVEGRVSVTLDRESGQYSVAIADAVVGDSAVYQMEVCSVSVRSEEVCVNATVTVFVLDCELLCV